MPEGSYGLTGNDAVCKGKGCKSHRADRKRKIGVYKGITNPFCAPSGAVPESSPPLPLGPRPSGVLYEAYLHLVSLVHQTNSL